MCGVVPIGRDFTCGKLKAPVNVFHWDPAPRTRDVSVSPGRLEDQCSLRGKGAIARGCDSGPRILTLPSGHGQMRFVPIHGGKWLRDGADRRAPEEACAAAELRPLSRRARPRAFRWLPHAGTSSPVVFPAGDLSFLPVCVRNNRRNVAGLDAVCFPYLNKAECRALCASSGKWLRKKNLPVFSIGAWQAFLEKGERVNTICLAGHTLCL